MHALQPKQLLLYGPTCADQYAPGMLLHVALSMSVKATLTSQTLLTSAVNMI
jgi:hypothetical protein